MEFDVRSTSGLPGKLPSGAVVVVGVLEADGKAKAPPRLLRGGARLDALLDGKLTEFLLQSGMRGKVGESRFYHPGLAVSAAGFLFVGLGKEDGGEKAFVDAVRAAVRAAREIGAREAFLFLVAEAHWILDVAWRVRQAVLAAADVLYRFERFKSEKKEKPALKKIIFLVGEQELAVAQSACVEGAAMVEGIRLARDLGNLPANVCTPAHLAQTARELAGEHGFKCQVFEQKKLEKLGMRALLAVAQGAREAPAFIVLHYTGGKAEEKPLVFVGKGVTFDSGGISIKPAADMDEMKYDMCGAASVLGLFKTVARLALPINLVGLIPAAENMPDGGATRPGDIVTSLSGTTIEILNTDAEGRLLLCDALAYARRFTPEAIIDIATLTGACVVALGHVATGLFASDDALAAELLAAGERVRDLAWRLPVWEEYQELINGRFADVANTGGRHAGAITAACFLARFVKDIPWAHLDIAGTAWKSGPQKGTTGRPVALLAQFLLERVAARAQDQEHAP
ncbi:MAG: leucyl aminopeptidase [Zoogloeaceae bacterium]|jgi:leucyl aminopeptidase|nr:leucyl aminopeptidase [Zoogloeaceae bacterium]